MSGRVQSESVYVRLERGLFGVLPQLQAVLHFHEEDAVSLTVRRRGDSDWVAVLKRLDGDGRPEVAFGSGYDLVGCLLGLEGALAANRWREDKPWNPS